MSCTRNRRCLRGWALLLIVGMTPACWLYAPRATIAAVSDAEVKVAIDKAVAFLRSSLPSLSGGQASLATLALLKAGVPADSPEMKASLDKIAARVKPEGVFEVSGDYNYDAGVTLMALANADPKKYKKQIEVIAKFLIQTQGPNGEWDYQQGRGSGTGDTSISQYAILGLWEAARAGVPVPTRVWDKAANWHITRQQTDGGFTYHPAGVGGGGGSTYTMTVAGTASLLVARLHLFGTVGDQSEVEDAPAPGRKKPRKKFGVLTPSAGEEEEAEGQETVEPPPPVDGPKTTRLNVLDRSVAGGRKWLIERFKIDPQTPWQLYYLYGIERLTALAGIREFAGHDWYDEGATYLLAKQAPTGSWSDNCGPVPATSFGVMFLIKATQKMLNRPLRPERRFGGGLLVGGRGLPEDLSQVQVEKGMIKVRKLKGPVDELLAELENAQSQKVESAQSALIDSIIAEDPEALVGQSDRLLKLVNDPRPEVRRTAYWALGRTNDFRVAPVLIRGLLDPDLSCMVEARNALRYLSKRVQYIELPDEPTDAQRAEAVALWKKWYLSVRPYNERDDLPETVKP